jgi:hypothetical protein
MRTIHVYNEKFPMHDAASRAVGTRREVESKDVVRA